MSAGIVVGPQSRGVARVGESAYRWLTWLVAGAVAAYTIPNVMLAAIGIQWNIVAGEPVDWALWRAVVDLLPAVRFGSTGEWAWIYSPAFAWLLALIVPLGFGVLTAAKVASLALLRDWRLVALVLVSWGFWFDTAFGNFFTFSFVAAALAMRGSRGGAIAFLVLTLLMPRPIQVPMALWILWRMPSVRLPFAGLFVAHAAFVVLGGYAGPWLDAMTDMGGANGQFFWNVGPTRLLGNLWLAFGIAIAIPIAIYLTYRNRPGLAGLAISPYVIPQYLLFALLPASRLRQGDDRVAAADLSVRTVDPTVDDVQRPILREHAPAPRGDLVE